MKKTAAFHRPTIGGASLVRMALFAASTLLLAGLCATALGKPPVGKDGKLHACYRVKGKPKGALRIVPGRKTRCRRGERKVAWAIRARRSAQGTAGSKGSPGSDGAAAQVTANTSLTERLDTLSSRADSLEARLAGVTNGELLSVVDSLPTVESLCERNEDLLEQTNLLRDAIEGLGLSPALEAVGALEVPTLPEPLESFSCTAP
jgi:hypothetical protein